MTGIPLHICMVRFVGASFASVCSGGHSGGRKEAGDAARAHDKGRGVVDDASDRVSTIAHDVRDKVLWLDHLTTASIAAIFKCTQLER